MNWGELWNKHRWTVIFFAFIATLIIIEKIVPRKETDRRLGPGDYGPVKVEYLFREGPDLVPYEPSAPVTTVKPLWAPDQNPDKAPPAPKVQNFKTGVSRQAMTTATGYDGGCELPKIVREQTNSAFCLVCHEQHDVANPSLIPIRPETSHPMRVAVPTGGQDWQPVIYQNFVLVDGVVQCTTCHEYWSTPRWPKWIAADPVSFCQGCHNK